MPLQAMQLKQLLPAACLLLLLASLRITTMTGMQHCRQVVMLISRVSFSCLMLPIWSGWEQRQQHWDVSAAEGRLRRLLKAQDSLLASYISMKG